MIVKLDVGTRPVPFHVALMPLALPLLAADAFRQYVPPTIAIWSIVVTWALVLVSWAGLTVLTRNWRTSAIVVSLVGFGLFVDLVIARSSSVAASATRCALWIGVGALSMVVGRPGRDAKSATVTVNALALIMCGGWGFGMARDEVRGPTPSVKRGYLDSLPIRARPAQTPLPNIYVLVLDGYGRNDVLKRLYGYDDPLVEQLRARGFYVADHAASNYCQTALSLSSSLNLEYLAELLDSLPPDAMSRRACGTLIASNRVFLAFRRAGYRIVAFASEYAMVRFNDVDERPHPPVYLTDFENSLYDASPLRVLSGLSGLPAAWLPHQLRRYAVRWTLDRLTEQAASADQHPTLVFVHLLLPHPPFVFRPDGSYSPTHLPGRIDDGDHWRRAQAGIGPTYERGYVDNARFLGDRLVPIIDALLDATSGPNVALIMGDHGPGSRLHWEDLGASDVRERHGILLAMRFPEGDYSDLSPTITPINAMRTLLNRVLGAGLPLLDDRAYFSTWSHPYSLHEVTEQVR